MLRQLNLLQAYLNKPDFSAAGKLYLTAIGNLGLDVTPKDEIPDEVACAEVVNAIHEKAFGFPILGILQGGASTLNLYRAMIKSSLFKETIEPKPGDICISPTGLGNGIISNGHVGIVMNEGKIASNDSSNGLFLENYTLKSWKNRFVSQGGFPMVFFRRF